MTCKLIIELPAEADIKETYRWYKTIHPELSDRFRAALRTVYSRIIQNPEAYPIVGRRLRRILVPQFFYAVYYLRDGDTIRIFAVMHTSRDPLVWQGREH